MFVFGGCGLSVLACGWCCGVAWCWLFLGRWGCIERMEDMSCVYFTSFMTSRESVYCIWCELNPRVWLWFYSDIRLAWGYKLLFLIVDILYWFFVFCVLYHPFAPQLQLLSFNHVQALYLFALALVDWFRTMSSETNLCSFTLQARYRTTHLTVGSWAILECKMKPNLWST